MITGGSVHLYEEILALPGFATGHALIIGWQDYYSVENPLYTGGFHERLKRAGFAEVGVLDLFDPRAGLRVDLNEPVEATLAATLDAVLDVGSMEHVFNPVRCLENYLYMLRPGGHLFLSVPVCGWFMHGYFAFSPTFFRDAAKANDCEIVFEKYSDAQGVELCTGFPTNAIERKDVLSWLVLRKGNATGPRLKCAHEPLWPTFYGNAT